MIEWVFSGIGSNIATGLYKKFVKNNDNDYKPEKLIENMKTKQDVLSYNYIDKNCEVMNTIGRLNQYKDILQESNEQYTIPRLAKIMGFSSTGELECYFKGEKEPDFAFLEKFSDVFGINYDWLSEGRGKPFVTDGEHYPESCYSYIENLNPEKIYFIRSDAKEGFTGIILQINDYKCKIVDGRWHISSYVGAGGQMQIYSMYKLIKRLRENGYSSKCFGRTLGDKDFSLLFSGNILPSLILDKYSISYWWNDFMDINPSHPTSKKYEDLYGAEFIKAQEIVKFEL